MRLERVRFWQGFSAALALVLIGIAGTTTAVITLDTASWLFHRSR